MEKYLLLLVEIYQMLCFFVIEERGQELLLHKLFLGKRIQGLLFLRYYLMF
jgi:hypothetical protein